MLLEYHLFNVDLNESMSHLSLKCYWMSVICVMLILISQCVYLSEKCCWMSFIYVMFFLMSGIVPCVNTGCALFHLT